MFATVINPMESKFAFVIVAKEQTKSQSVIFTHDTKIACMRFASDYNRKQPAEPYVLGLNHARPKQDQ